MMKVKRLYGISWNEYIGHRIKYCSRVKYGRIMISTGVIEKDVKIVKLGIDVFVKSAYNIKSC